MPDLPGTLAAALHREEDWYIVQCLEVDVASQGHMIDEALANLAEAVELYLEEVDDPVGHQCQGRSADVWPSVLTDLLTTALDDLGRLRNLKPSGQGESGPLDGSGQV